MSELTRVKNLLEFTQEWNRQLIKKNVELKNTLKHLRTLVIKEQLFKESSAYCWCICNRIAEFHRCEKCKKRYCKSCFFCLNEQHGICIDCFTRSCKCIACPEILCDNNTPFKCDSKYSLCYACSTKQLPIEIILIISTYLNQY